MILKDLLGGLFKPKELLEGVGSVIDNLTTSKEEKELLKIKLTEELNRNTEAILDKANAELTAYLADTASARQRDIDANNSVNSSWLAKNITPLIAITVIILVFALFFYTFRATIPHDTRDIVIYVLGALSGALTQVISYYFGASKEKSNQIKI